MEIEHMDTKELLALLIGEKMTGVLYTGEVAPLFSERGRHTRAIGKLRAARELVRRSLLENLQKGNALNSPSSVREYLRLILRDREYEVFVVLYLDAQNRVISSEELFRGTLTQTSVYPREVVKRSLHFNAGAVILAHNHPSGVAEPSHADEALTQALKQALALVDVKVLDHFVVAGSGVMSFAECGRL